MPELKDLSTNLLHEPWMMTEMEKVIYQIEYPSPIIDHVEAARYARETLWALKNS